VVGLAAWPCVRESIGSPACLRAFARSAATISSSLGSITFSRDSATMSAYARLLMSSEVHAKWMNSSARLASAFAQSFDFSQYSIALTSWLVSASIFLIWSASSSVNAETSPPKLFAVFGEKGFNSWIARSAASAWSQSSSMRTR
jgi:hypothetical protein